MPDKRSMDDLLKKWTEAERAGDIGRGCPELSVLFYHVTEGQHLGEHSDHVTACPRCRKRLDLIHREVAQARGLRVLGVPVRRPVRWAGGVLALAASIILVFALWPEPTPDAKVAIFAPFAYAWPDDATMRGEGTSPSQPADPTQGMPDWVVQVLSDEQVKAAIDEQRARSGKVMYELRTTGRLMFDQDGGLTIAPDVDRDSEIGQRLDVLVTRDRQATERIVDALIRFVPEATRKNRSAVRRALNHWRATDLFGSRENNVE